MFDSPICPEPTEYTSILQGHQDPTDRWKWLMTLPLLIIIIFCTFVDAQGYGDAVQSRTSFDLVGPVKSLELSQELGESGKLEPTLQTEHFEFSVDGDLLQQTYSSEAEILSSSSYTYTNGQLTLVRHESDGEIYEEIVTYDTGMWHRTDIRDESGFTVLSYLNKATSGEGAVADVLVQLDPDDNPVVEEEYSDPSVLDQRRVFEYEDSLERISEYDAYDYLLGQEEKLYEGNCLSERIFSDASMLYQNETYTCDENGHPLTLKQFDRERVIATYVYTYVFDEVGNWIEKTTSELLPDAETVPLMRETRAISYY